MSDVGEAGPELLVLPEGSVIIPTQRYVVCTKSHEFPEGREIPEGSRWHADDPAVVAAPKKFAKES